MLTDGKPDNNPTRVYPFYVLSVMAISVEAGGFMTPASWEPVPNQMHALDVPMKFYFCEKDEALDNSKLQKLYDVAVQAGSTAKVECEVLEGIEHDCMAKDPNSMSVIAKLLAYIEA